MPTSPPAARMPSDLALRGYSPDLLRRFENEFGDPYAGPLEALARIEDPAFNVNPYPVYARMQEERPVFWYAEYNTWILTKHEDIRNALRTPEVFSSAHGILLFDAIKKGAGLGDMFDEGGEQLFVTDPPRHRELRRIMGAPFTPNGLRQLEERTAYFCDALLSSIAPGEPVDWVAAAAEILPAQVICSILGLEEMDRDYLAKMRVWSSAVEDLGTKDLSPAEIDAAMRLFGELNAHLAEMLEHKRRSPGQDFLTSLLNDDLDSKKLGEANLLGFAQGLFGAGIETSRALLASFIALMCEHPDQFRMLADDRSLIPSAIDEVLRWSPPARGFARQVMVDTEVRGQRLKAGERVFCAYDAGNRDPDAFTDPHRFDVRRPDARKHLAFGHGTHLCVAAPLARVEARVLLERLLDRFSSVEIAGEPRKIEVFLRNGWDSLPVIFR